MLQIPVFSAYQIVYEAFLEATGQIYNCVGTPKDVRDSFLSLKETVFQHAPEIPLDEIDEYAFCAPVTDKPLNAVFSDDGEGKWTVVIRNYE